MFNFDQEKKQFQALSLEQKIQVMKERVEDSKEKIRREKDLLHLRETILNDLERGKISNG